MHIAHFIVAQNSAKTDHQWTPFTLQSLHQRDVIIYGLHDIIIIHWFLIGSKILY